MKYLLMITVLLSGCANTQNHTDLLRTGIILTNTLRNAQSLTSEGVNEELTNRANRMLRGY